MKNYLKRMGLFVAILVLIPRVTLGQIITKKVSFPAGKTSTVINGTIVGEQTIDYTVGVNAGQTLKVSLKPTSKSSYFNVLPPGSQGEADFIGQTEGNTCSLNLTKSGTYKIRVYQMRSTARRGEKATYSLTISIPSSTGSGDSKVSGTNFNATGDLRAANGSKPTSAKFGVIRSNGGAEVHATMLGKSKRVFVFSKGEWTCKSTGCKLSFAKISSDEWEIICNGTEKFYIPDAVIYGG